MALGQTTLFRFQKVTFLMYGNFIINVHLNEARCPEDLLGTDILMLFL